MAFKSSKDRTRRELTAAWRHIDWILVVATAALACVGVVIVTSSTLGVPAGSNFTAHQITFTAVGAVAVGFMCLFDYSVMRRWSWVLYATTVLMLVIVMSPLGQRSKGAQAWFGFGVFQLQPAEFAKVALVVLIADLLSRWSGDISLRRIIAVLCAVAVPAALVVAQPDLGMMLAFVVLVVGMLAVGGARGRHLLLLVAGTAVIAVVAMNSSLLHQYQKDRLTAFIDPTHDAQGSGYNVNQARTTIASGGVTGRGLFHGPMTQLHFVPEQHTDFIFTAVGEELGFVGSAVVLGLFGVLIWRVLRAARLARDTFGSLLCCGVVVVLTFQIFENVGMAVGIMPVTGIPLPLLSYGGSSALTTLLLLGVVLNVGMNRYRSPRISMQP